MSFETQYNLKSPGVKRLMREAKELAEPTEEYFASPLEDNLFEWHFTVRGPPATEFEGGYYHGRILLPTQYPMQPPNIILLTPNGRFEINKKICLSISGHHPESWQPSWSIRTALLALIAFMPTSPAGTIGSLDYSPQERKNLATKSLDWNCSSCGNISQKLLQAPPPTNPTQEESTLIKEINLKAEEDSAKKEGGESKAKEDEKLEEPVSSPTGDQSTLRQRNVVDGSASAVSVAPSATDSLLQASIRSVNRDKFWSTIIWVILAMILLLVIRRAFFL
ncbi:PREDICTED: ubiquitin-conjugating enzyme E2 J1-like [Nicrophorus vespilloides]|uniref:Ubiquitin-conjugating enzyme E2 J1-like n=1 Tax=Nicrophorus vespilloides TaxID=110193 RepID=A0ABM1NGR9_NICVS|nr:PREDICTED: ubiquitin-conjugating enzyme E2 J1-like [Nicrophorus vespilloides]